MSSNKARIRLIGPKTQKLEPKNTNISPHRFSRTFLWRCAAPPRVRGGVVNRDGAVTFFGDDFRWQNVFRKYSDLSHGVFRVSGPNLRKLFIKSVQFVLRYSHAQTPSIWSCRALWLNEIFFSKILRKNRKSMKINENQWKSMKKHPKITQNHRKTHKNTLKHDKNTFRIHFGCFWAFLEKLIFCHVF